MRTAIPAIFACASLLCLPFPRGWSQTGAPASGPEPPLSGEKTLKSQEVTLNPQQLQEQHQQLLKAIELLRRDSEANLQRHATAVERIRKDTDASLKRFSAAVDGKLDLLNQAFVSEREREVQALRSSNRFALTAASVIVGLLLFEILVLAWLSVRAVNRLATRMSGWISEQSSFSLATVAMRANAVQPVAGTLVEETSLRLHNAIERLEERLGDLEQTTTRFQAAFGRTPTTRGSSGSSALAVSKSHGEKPGKSPGVALALGEGESLIFLPQEKGPTRFHVIQDFLQNVRKRFHPARITKGH